MGIDITLVTGNANKLAELKEIFPAQLHLRSQAIDAPEIQSLDLDEIVAHKLSEAYKIIGGPVIVEDVSAELENLNGLPGPFIKFFEQKIGNDALYKLSNVGTKVIIKCCMGYYDGKTIKTFTGILHGTITEPRGKEGFGFDFVVIPSGYSETLAALGLDIKNKISHRYKAAVQLAEYLGSLNKP